MSLDLTRLQSLDPESIEFEAERCRLIEAEIQKVPAEKRNRLKAFQMGLDLYREQHGAEMFLKHIADQLRENVENLEDVLQYLKNTGIK